MSVYTRWLNALGSKEARRIELSSRKTIKELRMALRSAGSENELLKEMMIKAEERHIKDITTINAKLDEVNIKLEEWITIARRNSIELDEAKKNERISNEQRDMWMSLVESALDSDPNLKLSQLLKQTRNKQND